MKVLTISDGLKDYFQKFYPNHKIVGLLEEPKLTRVIVKGEWTPSGCARDCGDYLIIARNSCYDKVDKKTLVITKCVKDC